MYLTGFAKFRRPNCGDPQRSRLPQTFVLDPGRMYGWAAPGNGNSSQDIDTLIPSGLYRVPGSLSRIYNNEPLDATGLIQRKHKRRDVFSLSEATLRRGAAVGIASGQRAAREAGIVALGEDQLAPNKKLYDFLRRYGMLERTPLFYYILREAEVSGRFVPAGRRGKRLGPLGSRIVAEVLLGLLQADPDSFVHTDWQPPPVMLRPGRRLARIDTLKKLALYANEYVSP